MLPSNANESLFNFLPGFFQGITPKGVALLLNGLPSLRHVVYDVMSDVLTYVDFNTSSLPRFGLKTVLFHSMELLSSNHLELVTKLCPEVEWLSLNSALFYNLEGLGRLPRLSLLRLHYKSRPLDQTVADFFSLNAHGLTTLHLFEVKDLHLDDLHLTIGQCHNLETLVLFECSLREDWSNMGGFGGGPHRAGSTVLSKSVTTMQLISFHLFNNWQLVEFLSHFRGLRVLEMDCCELNLEQLKRILASQPELHTLRCPRWPSITIQALARLHADFRSCRLVGHGPGESGNVDSCDAQGKTMAASLLAEYANFAPTFGIDAFSSGH